MVRTFRLVWSIRILASEWYEVIRAHLNGQSIQNFNRIISRSKVYPKENFLPMFHIKSLVDSVQITPETSQQCWKASHNWYHKNHFSSNDPKSKWVFGSIAMLFKGNHLLQLLQSKAFWLKRIDFVHTPQGNLQTGFFFCLTMITGPGLGLFLYFHIVPVFFRSSGHICTKVSLPARSKNKMADLRYKYNSDVLRMLTTIKDSGSM